MSVHNDVFMGRKPLKCLYPKLHAQHMMIHHLLSFHCLGKMMKPHTGLACSVASHLFILMYGEANEEQTSDITRRISPHQ